MAAEVNEKLELGQYIPIHYHYQMLLDEQRVGAFSEAINAVVEEGSKVLELGGGTGILSFFASKKASKVYCVEQNPALVAASRKFLEKNGAGQKVTVIEADAMTYVPPEPVDLVICEMLHSALLREKQIQVLDAFQQAYTKKFPDSSPRIMPDATILGVQPVHQDFVFQGYNAPVPMFFAPGQEGTKTEDLGEPFIYSMFEYRRELPKHFACSQEIVIAKDGVLNALRFVTKNILAIILSQNRSVDWHNQYLIIPLPDAIPVKKGDKLKISFSYPAGGRLDTLSESVSVKKI